MPKHLTIKDIQGIASHYGGKCLSKEYINTHSPLEWMCAKGHTWDSPYSLVQQGGWCQQCAKKVTAEEKLEELKGIAKKHNFKVLSDSYKGSKVPLKFQCKMGHSLEKTFMQFKDSPSCYVCYRIDERERGFKKLQAIAQKKKGKLLSKKYFGTLTKLKWQCKEGHIWTATGALVYHHNLWCPKCRQEKRKETRLEKYQQIAKTRKGLLLSDKYINKYTNLKWQCDKGHRWMATPANVQVGSWCSVCYFESLKLSIKEVQKLAKKREGKLLSDKYINNYSPLKWQCTKGHIWLASQNDIKAGGWCPKCFLENQKLSIEEFHQIAKDRGGKLLSKNYVNSYTHLKWRCKYGHEWEAVPGQVKIGTWCPYCAGKRKK